MPRYEVKARRYMAIPDEPLRRRLSWPPRTGPTKPAPWNPSHEELLHFALTRDPKLPANDPGYDADEEDNVDRDPFMLSIRERRLAQMRIPTPPPSPPPQPGAWRNKSFYYGM